MRDTFFIPIGHRRSKIGSDFNFGVLCPQNLLRNAGAGSESSFLQTECLLKTTPSTQITVKVRFLHLVQRLIRRFDSSGAAEYVDRMEVNGRVYQPWQEAAERSFTCDALDPALLSSVYTRPFSFPAGTSNEELRDEQGHLTGEIVRQWQNLAVSLQVHAESCGEDVVKLRLRVENRTAFDASQPEQESRDNALLHSLVSAHAVVGVENGVFFSLLEPPPGFEDLARSLENKGAWPVLAGDDATTILASPIILYDYPAIAPEKRGNPLRRDRNRRDPFATDPDPDRRRKD